jgi:hypothetical protein
VPADYGVFATIRPKHEYINIMHCYQVARPDVSEWEGRLCAHVHCLLCKTGLLADPAVADHVTFEGRSLVAQAEMQRQAARCFESRV